jgi:hypothetical protein
MLARSKVFRRLLQALLFGFAQQKHVGADAHAVYLWQRAWSRFCSEASAPYFDRQRTVARHDWGLFGVLLEFEACETRPIAGAYSPDSGPLLIVCAALQWAAYHGPNRRQLTLDALISRITV